MSNLIKNQIKNKPKKHINIKFGKFKRNQLNRKPGLKRGISGAWGWVLLACACLKNEVGKLTQKYLGKH